jgi:hypothetical protein
LVTGELTDGRLDDVAKEALVGGDNCYLAASRRRPDDRNLVLNRKSLRFPGTEDDGFQTGAAGATLVHGPYWFLQSGAYDIFIDGEIQGSVAAACTHEFGYSLSA